MKTLPKGFARRMVDWQRLHGRQSLPWQNTQDPYRVWLSEIMLQQTQVSTVLDYFPRFLTRFPDVASLAAAPQDDVLALWSGLGYYSRARNLHKCAQEVMGRFGGAFPRRAEDLQTLPGIGRSTAAAIAAFCFQERAAILDGNVKRVLTRVLGYGEDLAVSKNEKALWALAQDLLPAKAADMPRYTQALITQMAQTAVCNRHHALDQQLCRWLLLSIDRLPGNDLVMTQELIANMLGVRREGVTEAAGRLQADGLIQYSRGHIKVLDRGGLEKRVCECYAVVKKEYNRLLPDVIEGLSGSAI
jgi:A/G-specific adenine glycosylase